jgi:hypothetical protein
MIKTSLGELDKSGIAEFTFRAATEIPPDKSQNSYFKN